MENTVQGNASGSALEVREPVCQRHDDQALSWSYDHSLAPFIETYASIGLGGFGSLLAIQKRA